MARPNTIEISFTVKLHSSSLKEFQSSLKLYFLDSLEGKPRKEEENFALNLLVGPKLKAHFSLKLN